ncbi:hypothetical protein ACFVWX_28950 [Streptomyces sp. NPDC058220]|uniref:hypothetical protein n=1 Tax=Streptomyces sp. NPDC058220 TaxID=3346387 RepID=UPI0036E0FBFE
MTTLNFVLQGRDALSRTLNGAGDAADRLRRRMDDAANRSARALAGFTTDADGRLLDLQGRFITTEEAARRLRDGIRNMPGPFADARREAKLFGDELKSSWISLIPAAIPAGAGLAGAAAAVTAQLGAAGVAAAAYGAALAPQVAAISEVTAAQAAYDDAVATSGRTSAEAATAQAVYQQRLAALPPATREAAVAVGLLREDFQGWSDSLSGDVMAPFNKSIAVTNALLPKTSGLVTGAAGQFDRLITLAGGAVESPGFDQLNDRFTDFADDTMRDAVDGLTEFFAKVDSGEINGNGLEEFLDYCREQGPVVEDTLRNLAEAAFNLLEAGGEVGVGMLDLINALSSIVAAVPPGAIAAMLQMAIAIKAVRLAAAGGAAAQAALAGFGTQLVTMRAAAAGTPGRLAGVGAAITGLSRTAKLAMAGTGIGLLLIALGELSQYGQATPPDVDKLTGSLARLGATGEVTGEAASLFGTKFEKLRDQINAVINPNMAESFNNWGSDITGGFLSVGYATEEFTQSVDAVDESLAGLVSEGKADLAAAALKRMLATMNPEQAAKFTAGLGDYRDAIAAAAFEQQLAAQAQGLFGAQALEVQAKLDEQKASADALSQSIHALNNAYLTARGGVRGMEAAIDAATGAVQKNGRTLDENSEKGRANNQALDDLAAATMKAAEAARANGASWETVSGIQDRGRQAFIRSAEQMGLNEAQARSLANQILRTPDKTAYLRGDVQDLKAKLADAKKRLAAAPSSKTARIKGEIGDLQRKIAAAERELAGIDGKTATAYINVRTSYFQNGPGPGPYAPDYLRAQGGPIRRAAGGPIPGYPGGGLLQGPGTSTSDSILLWGSDGEYMIKAASVAKYGMAFMDELNAGRFPVGRSAASPGRPAAAPAAGRTAEGRPPVTYNVYPRSSVIDVQDLRLLQRQEEARQRVGRPR